MSKIAELWVKEILAGRKTKEEVPTGLQKEVHALLQSYAIPEEESQTIETI